MGTDTLVGPVLAALIGLAPAAASSAPTREPGPAHTGVVSHVLPSGADHQREIVRYWTLDRMINAVSPVLPKAEAQPRPHQRGGTLLPGALAGRQTARTARAPSATSPGAIWPAAGAIRATAGKVFFTVGGRDFLCSAATVKSRNRDLVVTAGHCTKNGKDAWAENWIFVPGYQDGAGPGGGFTARRMFVPDRWSAEADDDYDVAMVALATTDGRHVADVVGAQPIGFGRSRGEQTYGFGYPASGRYDGEKLAYCSGRPHDDPHDVTVAQGLPCDMTQGSSGGPWLSGFDPRSGTGTITSISSFKYADDHATMYGPYFGPAIRRLYDQSERA